MKPLREKLPTRADFARMSINQFALASARYNLDKAARTFAAADDAYRSRGGVEPYERWDQCLRDIITAHTTMERAFFLCYADYATKEVIPAARLKRNAYTRKRRSHEG
jgi:hypothetical protein